MRQALGQHVELEAAKAASSHTPWGAGWGRPFPGILKDDPDEGHGSLTGARGSWWTSPERLVVRGREAGIQMPGECAGALNDRSVIG
jgi:hypothetical protein